MAFERTGGACAVLAVAALASGDDFTIIADTSMGFYNLQTGSINDAGQYAFEAAQTGGGGVYRGDGGPLTLIAPAPHCCPSINSAGRVAVRADGIYVRIGGSLTPIVELGGGFTSFGGPSMNDAGQIAFIAKYNGGDALFRYSPGDGVELVVDTSGPIQYLIGSARISQTGSISFLARLDNDEIALFRSDMSGGLVLIADTVGEVRSFGLHSIRSDGMVAFAVGYDDDEGAVLLGDGVTTVEYVNTDGPLDSPGSPQINDAGDVIYSARLDGGAVGIYTGPNVIKDKLIQSGDRAIVNSCG